MTGTGRIAAWGCGRVSGASLYCSLGMRRDALFEVCDALACRPERVRMLAEMCLEPECRRGHGGVYEALNCGEVAIGRLRHAVDGVPLRPWDDGRIRLACDVSNWLRPDAETSRSVCSASWRRAFEVLEGDPRAVACLMTSMTDPVTSNFLICWPLYREGEDVYVQNAIVLLDEIEGRFDPGAPWGSVEPRLGVDDDGNRISEWATSMGSLREFFG